VGVIFPFPNIKGIFFLKNSNIFPPFGNIRCFSLMDII
jgi:hypothetical protein